MILLSGKTEDEIKIEYTGLRKGEKMNEQLFFNNEKFPKLALMGYYLQTANSLT